MTGYCSDLVQGSPSTLRAFVFPNLPVVLTESEPWMDGEVENTKTSIGGKDGMR